MTIKLALQICALAMSVSCAPQPERIPVAPDQPLVCPRFPAPPAELMVPPARTDFLPPDTPPSLSRSGSSAPSSR